MYKSKFYTKLFLELIIILALSNILKVHSVWSAWSTNDGENEEIRNAKKILRGIYPDVDLNTSQIIEKEGYPVETHYVTTEDGFILCLYRIPQHGHRNMTSNKRAVLIMHGGMQSSVSFVINGKKNSLAYQFADEGYDVWLPNFRGTTDSYKHVNYTMANSKYWEYSFHEMGVKDLPACIDYILSINRQKDLFYVGYSFGSTMGFVLLSALPEYNKKIRLFINLAPAVYFGYWQSPLKFIAPVDFISLLLASTSYGVIGDNRIRPERFVSLLRKVAPEICRNSLVDDLVCNNMIFFLVGYDYAQRNNSNLPAILAHTPTTVSSKCFLHIEQVMNSNRFAYFDYGRRQNFEMYGQSDPPLYDLSKISSKVAIFWGPGDHFVVHKSVERTAKQLRNLVAVHKVKHEKFNHLDFTYAKDAKTLVYDHVINLANRH